MDKAALNFTYPIIITLENEIEQKSVYVIEVIAIDSYVEPEKPIPVVIPIDDLEIIESIKISGAKVDLKGLMTIKFEEFIYANETSSLSEVDST